MKKQILIGMVFSSLVMGSLSGLAETTLEARTSRAVVYKDGYVMVTKEVTGTIGLDGRGVIKKEPVTMLLQAEFGGACTEASDKGTFRVSSFQGGDWENCTAHPDLNSHSTVTWELTLKAGETQEVSCKYHYFLR